MTNTGWTIKAPIHGNRNFVRFMIYNFSMDNLDHIFHNLLNYFHILLADLPYFLYLKKINSALSWEGKEEI